MEGVNGPMYRDVEGVNGPVYGVWRVYIVHLVSIVIMVSNAFYLP